MSAAITRIRSCSAAAATNATPPITSWGTSWRSCGRTVTGGAPYTSTMVHPAPPSSPYSGRMQAAAARSPRAARGEGARMQFGRYYEQFEVGAVYRHWPGKTVTEYDDHLFCLLTMNHHPLHLDAHFAAEATEFGKNVVVGNYVYSLLLGMSVPDVSGKAIANLEVESLRHVKPTFHGDTLYGETTVLDKSESRSKDDRGVVHVETIGYNQDGKVVCIFRRKVMVPKDSYLEARGGEQPGRPVPAPDKFWPGPA